MRASIHRLHPTRKTLPPPLSFSPFSSPFLSRKAQNKVLQEPFSFLPDPFPPFRPSVGRRTATCFSFFSLVCRDNWGREKEKNGEMCGQGRGEEDMIMFLLGTHLWSLSFSTTIRHSKALRRCPDQERGHFIREEVDRQHENGPIS